MFRVGNLPYHFKSSLPINSFARLTHDKFPFYKYEDKKNILLNGFVLNKTHYLQLILHKQKFGFDYIISNYQEDKSYKLLYYKVNLHFLYKNNELIENIIFDEDITIYRHFIKLNDHNTKQIYTCNAAHQMSDTIQKFYESIKHIYNKI